MKIKRSEVRTLKDPVVETGEIDSLCLIGNVAVNLQPEDKAKKVFNQLLAASDENGEIDVSKLATRKLRKLGSFDINDTLIFNADNKKDGDPSDLGTIINEFANKNWVDDLINSKIKEVENNLDNIMKAAFEAKHRGQDIDLLTFITNYENNNTSETKDEEIPNAKQTDDTANQPQDEAVDQDSTQTDGNTESTYTDGYRRKDYLTISGIGCNTDNTDTLFCWGNVLFNIDDGDKEKTKKVIDKIVAVEKPNDLDIRKLRRPGTFKIKEDNILNEEVTPLVPSELIARLASTIFDNFINKELIDAYENYFKHAKESPKDLNNLVEDARFRGADNYDKILNYINSSNIIKILEGSSANFFNDKFIPENIYQFNEIYYCYKDNLTLRALLEVDGKLKIDTMVTPEKMDSVPDDHIISDDNIRLLFAKIAEDHKDDTNLYRVFSNGYTNEDFVKKFNDDVHIKIISHDNKYYVIDLKDNNVLKKIHEADFSLFSLSLINSVKSNKIIYKAVVNEALKDQFVENLDELQEYVTEFPITVFNEINKQDLKPEDLYRYNGVCINYKNPDDIKNILEERHDTKSQLISSNIAEAIVSKEDFDSKQELFSEIYSDHQNDGYNDELMLFYCLAYLKIPEDLDLNDPNIKYIINNEGSCNYLGNPSKEHYKTLYESLEKNEAEVEGFSNDNLLNSGQSAMEIANMAVELYKDGKSIDPNNFSKVPPPILTSSPR